MNKLSALEVENTITKFGKHICNALPVREHRPVVSKYEALGLLQVALQEFTETLCDGEDFASQGQFNLLDIAEICILTHAGVVSGVTYW